MPIKNFQDLTLADDFMFGEVYAEGKSGVRFCLRSFYCIKTSFRKPFSSWLAGCNLKMCGLSWKPC